MKVYIFGGSKENPHWYYTECRLSRPYFGYSRKSKSFYCYFIADHSDMIGAFYCISFLQLLVLPFRHRLYFREKSAKKQRNKNYRKIYDENGERKPKEE